MFRFFDAAGSGVAIAAIVSRTQARGGGIRTLLYELIGSTLFQTR